MENDAVKVYEETGIVVEETKSPEKLLPKIPDEVFLRASRADKVSVDNEAPSEKRRFVCCCCCTPRESEDLELAGSSSVFHEENMPRTTNMPHKGCWEETRSFLDSAAYYVFVIVLTFVITIFMLVEVFIDAGLLHVALPSDVSASELEKSEQETRNISTALHWFSFAILCLFFVEIIIRIVAWRMKLVQDFIMVFDCIIVFIAFLSNLCITLAAGSDSPIDAISLIIVLRLIRIFSVVKARVKVVKKQSSLRLRETESELATANVTVNNLRRQIMEKDFEIKQLHTYLGGGVADPQLNEVINASKEEGKKGAAADKDLEMAIALSKEEFNKENGIVAGETNRAFLTSESSEDNYGVLVHTNPRRMKRQVSDLGSNPQVASYIEEYFSKATNGFSQILPNGTSPGAKSKCKLPVISVDTSERPSFLNDQDDATLPVISKTLGSDEPLTICVDPDILLCDDEATAGGTAGSKYVAYAESGISSDNLSDPMTQEATSVNRDAPTCNGSTDATLSESRVSSPDLPYDANVTEETNKSVVNAWIKNSGSSLGSESGYQSEDLSHSANKKLSLPSPVSSSKNDNHSSQSSLTAL